jgi:hypothetical protein
MAGDIFRTAIAIMKSIESLAAENKSGAFRIKSDSFKELELMQEYINFTWDYLIDRKYIKSKPLEDFESVDVELTAEGVAFLAEH